VIAATVSCGQQLAGADDDEVVSEHGELADEVAGDEDAAASLGEGGQVGAQPADAVRVEAVRRLVEQQDLRFAEQRAGQREALAHAQGEAAGALVGGRLQADLGQDGRHPVQGDATERGRRAQVLSSGPARVHAACVEHRADDTGWVAQVGVGDAVVGDAAAVGAGQADHRAHRRRLAGAVGADEAGHPSSGHSEAEVVDGGAAAVGLVQVRDGDHG
jgi:hypothetical protein